MSKYLFLMAAVMYAIGSEAATATVTSVGQNWPWDTKVRIGYTLAAESGRYSVAVKVRQGADAWTLSPSAIRGDFEGVTAGDHQLIWDPSVDAVTNFPSLVNATFIVEPVEEPATPMKDYLIVDLSGGADATMWPVTAADTVDVGDDAYKTTKILFRRVHARGEFMQGAPADEPLRHPKYEGSKSVSTTLTNDYYMAVYELTQEQMNRITGQAVVEGQGGAYPAYAFAWTAVRGTAVGTRWPDSSDVDADSLIGRLRARAELTTDFMPEGWKFDLPTDAQWEFACRAGTTTAWNNGTDVNFYTNSIGKVVDDNLDKLAWYSGNSGGNLHPVGLKQPNAFGLYDMHGGVWEMTLCSTFGGAGLYGDVEPVGAGCGSDGSQYRTIRGGSYKNSWNVADDYMWNVAEDGVAMCRSAARARIYKSTYDYAGCRLAIRYSLDNAGHDLEKYPAEQYPYR